MREELWVIEDESPEFLTLQASGRALKLLVDSGFTGKSSLILGNDARELVRAEIPPAQATGALQGTQNRGWVTCRIPDLNFQRTVIGIITVYSWPTECMISPISIALSGGISWRDTTS